MNDRRNILTYELYELLLDYLIETAEPFTDFVSKKCKNYDAHEVFGLIITLLQGDIYTNQSYFKNKSFSPQRTLQPDREELSLDDLLKARYNCIKTGE